MLKGVLLCLIKNIIFWVEKLYLNTQFLKETSSILLIAAKWKA
jgi:hypothetical protein